MSHLVNRANHISDITAPAYFSLLNSGSLSGGSSVIDGSHGVLLGFTVLISSAYQDDMSAYRVLDETFSVKR